MAGAGFVTTPGLPISITESEQEEAQVRLGARYSKYEGLRRKGKDHQTALDEAVKP